MKYRYTFNVLVVCCCHVKRPSFQDRIVYPISERSRKVTAGRSERKHHSNLNGEASNGKLGLMIDADVLKSKPSPSKSLVASFSHNRV